MRREPRFHTLQSFLFNLRKLGPLSWLRCALINGWRAVRRRNTEGRQ